MMKQLSGISKLVFEDREKHIFRVDSAAYTDQTYFEIEMEKIFKQSWLYVGHETEISHPNDYVTQTLGPEPVILCRDDHGKIHCFANRCRHRGAQVCRSEIGNSNKFRCFYHNWTYRSDGKLIGVADRPGYPPDFDLGTLGLTELPKVENYKGFIFASLSNDVPSLEEHLGNTRVFIDLLSEKYPEGVEVPKGRDKFGFMANWKLYPENSVDIYHAPFVHKSFYDVAGLTNRTKIDFIEKNTYLLYLGHGHLASVYCYGDDPKATSTFYQTEMKPYVGNHEELLNRLGEVKAKWLQRITGFHLYVFPNMVIFDGEPPSPQIRVLNPISADRTEVVTRPYVPKSCTESVRKTILKLYERATGPASGVTPDDMEVLNSIGRGFKASISPWIDMSRGMHRERYDLELKELVNYEVGGYATDDTLYREFFRWWIDKISKRETNK